MTVKALKLEYHQINKVLEQHQLAMTAAEIHGLITGLIVGEHDDEKRMALLYELTNEGLAYPNELREAILSIVSHSQAQLAASDFSFVLLMPNKEQEVFDRIDALSEWVNHFLLGLGVTRTDIHTLTGESKEIFDDLRDISKLGYDMGDEIEVLESSLENVLEYVKMAAIFYYGQFQTPKSNALSTGTLLDQEALILPENKTLH